LVRDHENWTAPLVFFLSFLESFAFVSLIVPATFVLLGIGALIGAAGSWHRVHTPARLRARSSATAPRSNSFFGLGRN
jgi:membrane protein DedA with SNARE-associated domain